ncbi:MAG: ComEC/Rec2 family competence protein [Myxococcota bacterium]
MLEANSSEAELRVHFLDVGQGDAILIISPVGKAVLVDAGPRAGGEVVLEAMRREGVESLDLVLVSHPHLDHLGGVPAVLEQVPVRFYMDPGYAHGSRAYESLLALLEEKQIPVLTARTGRRINLGGGAVMEILAPPELFSGTRSDANANSAIARVEYGSFSMLLTGDTEAETESFLLTLPSIESQILKVPHHGSAHSSASGFLRAVSAEVGIVSVGQNSYGHPHPDALQRLEEAGMRVYRTDVHGTVSVTTDGTSYSISTERSVSRPRAAASAAEGEGESALPRGPPAGRRRASMGD